MDEVVLELGERGKHGDHGFAHQTRRVSVRLSNSMPCSERRAMEIPGPAVKEVVVNVETSPLPTGSAPDTPGQRLEMFLALAGQFIDSVDVLDPLPAIPRGGWGSREARRHLWQTKFKLMLLRKFYAPSDQVQIPKVVAALRELNQGHHYPNVDATANWIEQAWDARDPADLWNDLRTVLEEEPGRDPFDVLLYGELLHADANKFYKLQRLDESSHFILQLISGAQLEKTVRYAYEVISSCFDPKTHQLRAS